MDIEPWLQNQHVLEDPVEQRMRAQGEAEGFPIIGPLVGQLCRLLATSIGAKRVFEMGSGFGYSTHWFAQAVGPGGEVVHTDGDPALSAAARANLEEAALLDRCRFVVGDALATLSDEKGPFDVIFIDVDKGDYPRAWELAVEKVRVGGYILTDNTLWSGKVADPAVDDEWTVAVREYDRLAFTDERFQTSIIPLRDGLAVSLRVA